jgi:hypothetical protein
MKYSSIIILFIGVLFSSSPALAQDYLFKILASNGENKIVRQGTDSKVTIGKQLIKGDRIVVGNNSYLGLAHKNGKTIEIKKAGTYSLNDLDGQVAAQNQGISKKYIDFLLGEASDDDEEVSDNKYKYMAVTGSVERLAKPVIQSFLPKDIKVLKDKLELSWIPVEEEKNYIVTLTNLFQDTIFTQKVHGNAVTIDLTKFTFEKDKIYKWTIEGVGLGTDFSPRVIRAMEEKEEKELSEEIRLVKAELKEETALNKFVLANIYAEKNLLIEAISSYQAAIKLAPEVEAYKIAYGKFLEAKELATVAEKK